MPNSALADLLDDTSTYTVDVPDTDSLLMLTYRVRLTGNAQAWDVRDVEIYADIGCTQLLADDVWAHLPESGKLAIYAALNTWAHQREQAERAQRMGASKAWQGPADRQPGNHVPGGMAP